MSSLLAEAVLDELVRRMFRPKAAKAVDWLRRVAVPPEGVELVSHDGSLFTGILVVDRNRPILMLAARQSLPRSSYSSYSHNQRHFVDTDPEWAWSR